MPSKNKRLTVPEAAKFLGVCVQRVAAKIGKKHFPDVAWCECGRSQLIPISNLTADLKRKAKLAP
jgi:hypothetical protein